MSAKVRRFNWTPEGYNSGQACCVSSVVISYCQQDTIEQCLRSVLEQQLPEGQYHQLVFRDDASSDATWLVAQRVFKDFVSTAAAAKLIIDASSHGSNVGAIANLKTALDACVGEYVAVCEGDDIWLTSQKLVCQVEAMSNQPAINICFTAALKGPSVDAALTYRKWASEQRVMPVKQVALGGGSFMPSPSIVFRKSSLDATPPWVWRMPATDVYLQIFHSLSGGALYLPMVSAFYRQGHPASWSQGQIGLSKRAQHLSLNVERLAHAQRAGQQIDRHYLGFLHLWLAKKYYRLAKAAFRVKRWRLGTAAFFCGLKSLLAYRLWR